MTIERLLWTGILPYTLLFSHIRMQLNTGHFKHEHLMAN